MQWQTIIDNIKSDIREVEAGLKPYKYVEKYMNKSSEMEMLA